MFTPFAFIQPITTAAPIAPTLNYLLIGGGFSLYNAPSLGSIAKINSTGSLDSSFNMGAGFSNQVFKLRQQPDGKILAAGAFTSYSGSSSNRIVRLNQNGTIDTTFKSGTGYNNSVFEILPQSDNSNIIVGQFTTYSGSAAYGIVKINPSGAIDPTFSTGYGFNNISINSAAQQADGKVIVGGGFSSYSSSNNYIAVTDLSGSSISNPSLNYGVGFNGTVNTMVTQSDNKVLIAGGFTTYNNTSSLYIVRLNPDGTKDPTFVVGTSFNNAVYNLQVQPDGKIIATGVFTTYSGSTSNRIIRLNNSGSIDTTYNVGTGCNTTIDNFSFYGPDNKVTIVGSFTTYSGSSAPRIARINISGTLDTTFNPGVGFNSAPRSIAHFSDGSAIAVGGFTSYSGSGNSRVTKLNTDGTRVTGSWNITGLNNTGSAVAVEPGTDKSVIVGHFTTANGFSTSAIVKLNADGTRDTTFNNGTGFGISLVYPVLLSFQPDGKIYVGNSNFTQYSGSSANNFVRINPSGSRDSTFLNFPTASNSSGFVNGNPLAVFTSASNLYFIGGFNAYKGTRGMVRINTNGTIDSTFLMGEGFTSGGSPFSMAISSDGKILLGGQTMTPYSGSSVNGNLFRLNSNGTRDVTYNVGTGPNGSITSIIIQPDDKVTMIGAFTTYSGSSVNRIVRTNNSGARDATLTIGSGFDAMGGTNAGQIVADSTNNLYVASSFTTYSGSTVNRIVKLFPSGSIDTSFQVSASSPIGTAIGFDAAANTLLLSGSSVLAAGIFTTYKSPAINRGVMTDSSGVVSSSFNIGAGFGNTIRTWATQSDGKILAGGDFTTYRGSSAVRIARINRNGTVDNTFNIGTGFNSNVYNLLVQPDGKIIACGSFSTYSGSSSPGMIRLNTNGTVDNTFNVGTGGTVILHSQLQPDGKILAAGTFTSFSGSSTVRIARINVSGSVDNTFTTGVGLNGGAEALLLQPDGKVVVAGTFSAYSGSSNNAIVRINSDGTRDTTFNIGGGFTTLGGFALALQSDGKIICANASQNYSGSIARYIIRINPSGTLDTSFNANAIVGLSTISSTPNGLVIDASGSIYWGNAFTTFSGSFTPNRIVKLNISGSVDETFNQAYPNFVNNTGKGANSTVNALLLL